MVTYPSSVHVTDVARWLKRRKDSTHNTVLFLGARAGGLFRGKYLYSTAQYFSPRTFNNMSRVEQFDECYRVLHDEDFTRGDIHNIFITSLQGLAVSEADIALAQLVGAGFFDVVISTNIDDMLTRALTQIGLKETQDFHTFIPQKSFIDDLDHFHSNTSSLLIKTLGDLDIGEYNLIRQDLYFETHGRLKKFLIETMQHPMLMLGYDLFWDRTISAMLPLSGQDLWYVDEGQMEPYMLHILQSRRGKYILGGEGNYERFIQELHWYLAKEQSLNGHLAIDTFIDLSTISDSPEAAMNGQKLLSSEYQPRTPPKTTPPVLSQREKEQRRRVFICYSKKDKKHFEELQTHLATYEREKLVDVWSEAKIAAGTRWEEEIQRTLDITRVAILLVSADFLASDFIAKEILPPLLHAAESEGAIILPVLLGHCAFEDIPLGDFQPFNSSSEPLAAKKPNDRHKVWTELARYVTKLVKDV